MTLCLSKQELIDLAGASKGARASTVTQWLKANGFLIFATGLDGWPRVDRAHYAARSGGLVQSTKRSVPDPKALAALQEKH